MFQVVLAGNSILDIANVLNDDGMPSLRCKRWLRTTVHKLLVDETYTDTLVWEANDILPRLRVHQERRSQLEQAAGQRVDRDEGVHPLVCEADRRERTVRFNGQTFLLVVALPDGMLSVRCVC